MHPEQVPSAPDAANPYLNGIYEPVGEEVTVGDLTVDGELPRELHGLYLRNSPNPHFPPTGRYHWFDGDGMLHGVQLEGGRATYRNRYVRTRGWNLEAEAGRALWGGILDAPRMDLPGGPIKNTSNTDLVWHAGRLLTLWWLGGEPYQVSVPELETVGPYRFDGKLKGGFAAHPKIDPVTGELMFMDFSFFRPPYLQYGVVSASGELQRVIPIDIPAPRILHDLAITARHTLLMDLPMGWDQEALKRGRRRIAFDRETPARFGILPRHGDAASIRWFEAEPCYIYHTINAWEEGDEIVLTGCRVADPIPAVPSRDGSFPRLDIIELRPAFYRWRFNLATGQTREAQLDDRPTEFPRMNEGWRGRKTRYSYNPRLAPCQTLLFDGLVKYDTETDRAEVIDFGPGRYSSEPVFAARPGASAEDDGWLVTLMHDERDRRTELVVLEAGDLKAGPIARVKLPVRVPIGFHALWVDGEWRR